jgi:hypothetical protein
MMVSEDHDGRRGAAERGSGRCRPDDGLSLDVGLCLALLSLSGFLHGPWIDGSMISRPILLVGVVNTTVSSLFVSRASG